MAGSIHSITCLMICMAAMAPQALADKPAEKSRVKVEFRRAESTPAEGLIEATVVGSDTKVYLHKSPDLTNKDLAEATISEDSEGNPCLGVVFTSDGGKKMAKLSEEHLSKPLAILVDGKVVSAPIIRAKVSQRAVIAGIFTKAEIERLVKEINAK